MRSVIIALRDNYDLVFATSTLLTAGTPGIAAKVLGRKKFVFEVRDLCPELPRNMGVIKKPVELFSMLELDWVSYTAAWAFVGLSPCMVEGIRKRSDSNMPIALIPNGCDADLFRSSSAASNEHGRPFTAIFSGAHGKANGSDATAELLKRVNTTSRLSLLTKAAKRSDWENALQTNRCQTVVCTNNA